MLYLEGCSDSKAHSWSCGMDLLLGATDPRDPRQCWVLGFTFKHKTATLHAAVLMLYGKWSPRGRRDTHHVSLQRAAEPRGPFPDVLE